MSYTRFAKISIIVLLIQCISLSLFSQSERPSQNGERADFGTKGAVFGAIVDIQKQPMQYVTVYVIKASDSSVVSGGASGPDGRILITEIPWGTYMLQIDYMGYKRHYTSEFTLSSATPRHRLGQFVMKEKSTSLGEVEVVAQKEMIQTNLDKTVFNVENSIIADGATAVEVLAEVPSVDVDVEGNIQLRGSANITLLIDGRPTNLTLEEIPASEIASVEVITNPSARFEPDGMGGIINVILKKKRKQGINALFSINGGTNIFRNKLHFDNGGANLNFNYSYNKINIFLTYNFNTRTRYSAGELVRDSWFLRDTTHLIQEQNSNSFSVGHSARLAFDYLINTKNTLTLSLGFNHFDNKDNSNVLSENADVLLGDYFPYNKYEQITNGKWGNNNYRATLNYRKTFNKKGQELTADMFFTQRNNLSSNSSTQHFLLFDGTPDYYQSTQTVGLNRNVSSQVDFVSPVGNGGRIETGYKFSYRSMGQDYSLFYGENEEDIVEDINQSNDFEYREYLNALYFIYSNTFWKKFKVQLGLRGEMANTYSDLKSADTIYKKPYYNLFPTVHLRYDFNEHHSIQMSYSRRVTRPRFWDLNPFVNASDKLNLRVGNPNLMPEFANNLELSYSMLINKSTFNFVAFYRQRDNLIGRYTELYQARIEDNLIYYELGDNQIYTTPITSEFDSLNSFTYTLTSNQNINKSQSFGFELIYGQKLWKFWKITLSGSFYRTLIDSEDLIDPNLSKDWAWTLRLNQSFTLPKDWDIQVNFRFRSKSLTTGSMGFGSGGVGQGKRNANYSLNLGLKKSFLKKSLVLSVNFRNLIYNPKTLLHSYSYGVESGYDSHNTRYRSAFQASINLTYKLNNYKKRVDEYRDSEGEYESYE